MFFSPPQEVTVNTCSYGALCTTHCFVWFRLFFIYNLTNLAPNCFKYNSCLVFNKIIFQLFFILLTHPALSAPIRFSIFVSLNPHCLYFIWIISFCRVWFIIANEFEYLCNSIVTHTYRYLCNTVNG